MDASEAAVHVPVGYVYGALSALVDDEVAQHARVRGRVTVDRAPGAGHHVPLEAPEESAPLIAS
ncbi:MAG TPA: hypothetical protein VK402_15900 [Blastococcus sp.]|nr:hypothetical protein [Blastococcus sp.]